MKQRGSCFSCHTLLFLCNCLSSCLSHFASVSDLECVLIFFFIGLLSAVSQLWIVFLIFFLHCVLFLFSHLHFYFKSFLLSLTRLFWYILLLYWLSTSKTQLPFVSISFLSFLSLPLFGFISLHFTFLSNHNLVWSDTCPHCDVLPIGVTCSLFWHTRRKNGAFWAHLALRWMLKITFWYLLTLLSTLFKEAENLK